ncbi:MAG: GTP pyrophosphokinase family protein [Lachnospiraceae bacterium]|nr:GTP pyrophosphokinase family protein [Lachnospiraceae bacterium]MDD3616342.1 GTP pyrophosphokinase family protein [Lachnospiraceae bacterium]
MKNILKRLTNACTKKNLVEVAEESDDPLLPQTTDILKMSTQYKQIMFFYQAGIHQITTKLEILSNEFKVCNDRNPIKEIVSRVKSPESINEKMKRKKIPYSMNNMMNHIRDIAGIRVVCPFISDVYYVARMLMSQSDIETIEIKDYITDPKKNGYRSLHLILMVDVFFSDVKRKVPVEIQMRTVAMDFWASLEHQLRYKKNRLFEKEMERELKKCAELVSDADVRMQKLANGIMQEE